MSSNHFIPNSYQTPNALVDMLMPFLTCEEWRVLSYAVRHILGFQDRISNRQHRMSVSSFEKGYGIYPGCGLSRPAIMKALDALHKFHILKKIGEPTHDGQLLEVAFDAQTVDLDALRERQEQKKQESASRTKVARHKRLVGLTTGQSDLPLVSGTNQERLVGLTSAGQSDLPNQIPPSNTPSNPEEQIPAVSDEPAQADTPKSKRKPKRTEAEKLAAENADPVFLAVGQSVFAIEDPTILTDSGRKRMRPIVGKSKLLFDRQFTSTDNAVLRRILVAFAGSFEKGKCPRDYTKFEERFTAYLQSQSQNIRDLLAQPPAPPDLPPVVDEATGQRDYSKEILHAKRMLFAVGAIRAAEGMLEEYLKKNDDAA